MIPYTINSERRHRWSEEEDDILLQVFNDMMEAGKEIDRIPLDVEIIMAARCQLARSFASIQSRMQRLIGCARNR
ncbi:hypothetical protein [Endozoicomonas sp. ALB032]|uniref:hypothetical protein n=1 Tax=Endozoicomonas sp. ALB032 TaxID=3403082 RepID=UPI003BB5899A